MSSARNRRMNRRERINILTVGLSALNIAQMKTKQNVYGDARTPATEREEDVQRAVATAFPKNLIRPLPHAGTREVVGFRACSPDIDGASMAGWGR